MSTADFEHLRQDQNVGEVHISFAGASNAFKDVNLHAFAANHLEQTKGKTQRTALRDISNQQKVPPQRDASRSPIAKKGRPSNYAMNVLAQQIAAQVATAKQTQMAAGTSQTTGGNANGVSMGSPGLNVGITRDGNTRNMLPKVLHRASTSSAPATNTATATAEKGKNPQAATPLVNPPTYASKLTAGDTRGHRGNDLRGRNFEAWRAARDRRNTALMAAVASAECIRKNRARFDRLEESDHEEPPYPELLKQVELTEERKKEIRETFQFLRLSQSPTQGKVVRAVIDPQQLTNRLQFLKEKTFVLYTVDISPSRDAVMEWAEVVLHQEMGIKITRVRVLNKHCYLITVAEEEDRDWILEATPLYLGPHMVFALPWDPTFDSANLDHCKVPIWIELPNIHPCMEAFGGHLLQSIGEVLFPSCEESDCRFTSIRGCLKMDLSQELPEAIEVVDPETGETFLQPIVYKSMPNACFHCHQRGHLVRACPVRKQKKLHATKPNAEEKEEELRSLAAESSPEALKTKTQTAAVPPSHKSALTSNPFAALAESEEQEEEQNGGEASTKERQAELGETTSNTILQTTGDQNQELISSAEEQDNLAMQMEITKEKRKRDQHEAATGEPQTDAATSVLSSGEGGNTLSPGDVRTASGAPQPLNKTATGKRGQKKELRIRERDADFALTQLAEGGSFAVDYTSEGKVGAAVVIRNKWRITAQGARGDGTAVWVKAQTEKGEVGFVSVHGPRDRTKRARVWKWLQETCTCGIWIFGGDWNSVEDYEDSVGDSPIQRGSEQRRWTRLAADLDLGDGWREASTRSGPHFTRQKKVGERFDQARLDRFYFSRGEHWAEKQICMQHDAAVRLSDHCPVKISFIKQTATRRSRTSYFKTNPETLDQQDVVEEITQQWKEAGQHADDARIKWELKWRAMKQILKEKQKEKNRKLTEKEEKLLRVFTEPGEDWMEALAALLHKAVSSGRWASSRKHWNREEIMLTKCPWRIAGAKVTSGLLTVWNKAKTKLEITAQEATVSGETRPDVYIAIGETQGWLTQLQARNSIALL
ncbi:hypothetical protein R1sor_024175 [Riccia sorocarpa]|uniref:CCHC-type domain-containing protein n=1 Tax=Riccia sorocarpa TaxID=122646 RepID=A0ABD3GTS2_9MARC